MAGKNSDRQGKGDVLFSPHPSAHARVDEAGWERTRRHLTASAVLGALLWVAVTLALDLSVIVSLFHLPVSVNLSICNF